jgi:hypothetical protein
MLYKFSKSCQNLKLLQVCNSNLFSIHPLISAQAANLPSQPSTPVHPWRLQLNMLSSSNCPFRTVSHSLFIVATCRPHLSAPSPPPRRHHFPPLPAVPATPLGTERCCLCALTLPHPQNPSFTPINPAPTNNGIKAITPRLPPIVASP